LRIPPHAARHRRSAYYGSPPRYYRGNRFLLRIYFDPAAKDSAAKDWTFPLAGPLSGANGALPWIVFERDRQAFEAQFHDFEIRAVRPLMPIRYLISG
jgi:hypothetical protein